MDERERKLAVMELAMEAGQLLLENGAEISRVSETMQRICRHYGVESASFFTLTNGILASSGSDADPLYAKVSYIPVNSGRLDWVCAVNQLSREIESGCYTIVQAKEALRQIRRMPGKKTGSTIAASAIAVAAFSLMFGGSWADCLASAFAGLFTQIFVIYVSNRYLSRIVGKLAGGAFVTFVCLLLQNFGPGQNLSNMIISTLMVLIPGVSFVNGIRDIASSDYLSGAVRVLDALLGFACIAIGVAFCFMIYNRVFGGMIL